MPFTPGRVRQPGEHEVDDVLAHVLLAPGDEDLGAGHPVAPVAGRLGPRAQQPEVGAAVRLREAHDPGPGPFDELGQVAPAQRLVGVLVDRDAGAVGQPRTEREGHVRRLQHLFDEHAEGAGQSLAAELRAARQPVPAALDERAVGVAEPARGAHRPVLEGAAFLVPGPVEREHHVLAELRRLFEHRVDQIPGHLLESGQSRELPLCVEELVQHELHVPQRCLVRCHLPDLRLMMRAATVHAAGWRPRCTESQTSRPTLRTGGGTDVTRRLRTDISTTTSFPLSFPRKPHRRSHGSPAVIPAQAGIQRPSIEVDSRFRGNDGKEDGNDRE